MTFPIVKDAVFVFGSNESGFHGAGAAADAVRDYGAVYGQGVGRQGNSYAIPTKDRHIRTLDLSEIKKYVDGFIRYAKDHPDTKFFVTRIGCGLAGYNDSQISPMFRDAPENCTLPDGW